jgi:cytochrome c oxidase subunit 2
MSHKARVIQGSAVLAAVLALADAACSGPGTMTSNTAGQGAHRISVLAVGMFAIAAFVFLVVISFLAYGLFRRRRESDDGKPILNDGGGTRMVLFGGVAFPIVVLIVLFVITLVALEAQARDDTGTHVFTVDVIAHRWWWEFQYPTQGIDTANELHIPTGQPVLMQVTSDDVIHSFWVPKLQRKVDAIPGRTNDVTLEATADGTYLGECSEFCGLQHAHMQFHVIAESADAFNSWVADQQRTPPAQPTGLVLAGQQVFLGSSCVYCHSVSGTTATGTVGPNLTHVARRTTLAAGTIPNTPQELAAWIANPQSIKPGTEMPASDLTPTQLRELVAYLESLS